MTSSAPLRLTMVVALALPCVGGCGDRASRRAAGGQPDGPVPAEHLTALTDAVVPVDSLPPIEIPDSVRSPDGASVLYVSEEGRGPESTRYALSVRRAGGEARKIAEASNVFDVAWSPDGTKIAYCEGGLLRVTDADGATSRLLHAGPGGAYPGACYGLHWRTGSSITFFQVESVFDGDLAHPVSITLSLGPEGASDGSEVRDLGSGSSVEGRGEGGGAGDIRQQG